MVVQLKATRAGAEYIQKESFVGPDFFSKWDFFTGADPTHGVVEFAGTEVAHAAGLVHASDDEVYIGVDMNSLLQGGGRRSVRLHSKAVYNEGLFVLSLEHMPSGCGSWPAFWMFGYDAQHEWPVWGEFDILESVHESPTVSTTLHTRAGCHQAAVAAGRDFSGTWASGSQVPEANNCFVRAVGQFEGQGCAQQGPMGSTGAPFNAAGGGTFAAEWDPAGGHFRTWFWPAGQEPPDLARRRPVPNSWGTPYSYFSLSSPGCSPDHFQNMHMVLDITFCGDLGGARWEEMCPQLASTMSCEEFVLGHPQEMSEVFWSIKALDTYHWTAAQPERAPFPFLLGWGPLRGFLTTLLLVGLLLTLLVLLCYILDRLQGPQDSILGRLRKICPGWEAAKHCARRGACNPSGALADLAAAVSGCVGGSLDRAWEAMPMQHQLHIHGGRFSVGDPVIVRTPFVALGKYFGSKTLPPSTPGVIEEVLASGAVIIRFAHFWGASVVQPTQVACLDVPTEEEISNLHAVFFSKRGKAVVNL